MTGRSHILVVDDDDLVSEIVAAALEDDFDISLAATAKDGLVRMEQGGIDLLLLDCTLPDSPPLNLTKDADRLGIEVVLMSGDPAKVARIDDGKRRFIVKPFSLTEILDIVAVGLNGSQRP